MKLSSLAPVLALLGSLWLTGCALQPSPQFYQLDAGQPTLPVRDKGPAVLLGPLKLADYLQRENLPAAFLAFVVAQLFEQARAMREELDGTV